MSDSRDVSSPTAADLPIVSPVASPSSPLVRVGGLLGIAGSAAGLILVVVGCAGFAKSLVVAPGVAGAGALGLVVSLLGAFTQKRRIGEDTHVLQALFACLLSLLVGVVLTAVWMKWAIFK